MNSSIDQSARANPHLIPVTKWPDHHQWPTVSGLRFLIFNAEINGFQRCVKRVGRRVLIDEDEFFRWIEDQNGTKNGH